MRRLNGTTSPQLAQTMISSVELDELLARVRDIAMRSLPNGQRVAVTMTSEDVNRRVASDDETDEIDRLQFEFGDGPGAAALRDRHVVVMRCNRDSGEFRRFSEIARRCGIMSVAAVPMVTPANVVGTMTLYADVEDCFDDEELAAADHLASEAAIVLANSKAYWEARRLSEHLAEAMQSRAVIEQAKGIIMAASGVGPDEAFEVLKQQSQHEHIKLRDLARELVRQKIRRP